MAAAYAAAGRYDEAAREIDLAVRSHPTDVGRPDGSVARPIHRIQPVRVSLRGAGLDSDGTGSLTLIAEGDLPQLGLKE